MVITDVTVTIFPWQAGSATRLPGGGEHATSGDLGLVEIFTEAGISGLGFLGNLDHPASMDASALIHWLKPILVGADPLSRGVLYQRMSALTRHTGFRCLGAVDIALWDLAGKSAGLPIHKLIGTTRTAVPVYVSSQRFPQPEEYAEQAVEVLSKGWAGYKVHPPKFDSAGDIAVAKAVREAHRGATLFFDGGWAYSQLAAVQIGQAIEDLGYTWFEDPLGADDIAGYQRLHRSLRIPLIATELPAGSLQSYVPWLLAHATDALRGDVPTRGGITGMVSGARLAEAFGLNYEIHYSGNALADAANVQVAMAISNCQYLETPFPDPIHLFASDFTWQLDANGCTPAPEKPGLSVEIDRELIKRTALAVLR